MNFKTKLNWLGFLTLMGLGSIAAITLFGLNSIEEAQDAAHRRKGYVIDLLEVKASALSTVLLDPGLAETKQIFLEAEQQITQHGNAAVSVIKREQIKAELKQVLTLWSKYYSASQALIEAASQSAGSDDQKNVAVYNQLFRPFQARLEAFIELREQEAQEAQNLASEISQRFFWQIAALLLFVLLANVIVVLNLSGSLKRGLKSIQLKLQPLKAGDLTQRLPTEHDDELSEIGLGVNEFIQQLQQIVNTVRNDAVMVASAAEELAAASAQVFAGSERQSEATGSVAATTEEFSVSIDMVACHAVDAEHQAEKYGELSRQGGNDVQTAVTEIQRIEQTVNKSVEMMQKLTQQAHQITSIVKVIKDVADQTNLLALNAAIEAARAGESGRGFSVVADEVRNLAARTSKSAQEITDMIGSIQANTDAASFVMQQGNERVEIGVRRAEQAVLSMQQINDNSEQVMRSISDISVALREQRIAGTEIAKKVEYIAKMADENNAATMHVSSAANKLQQLSAELKQSVSKFKV